MGNRSIFLTGLLLCAKLGAMDATPVGVWQTVDDITHKPTGLIRLYEQDGEIFGKIEVTFDPKDAGDICSKCADERKGKPVAGLVVMRHMKKNGEGYSDGDILDPHTGWVYKCKFTVADGGKTLVVRGFIGFSLLGRSQIWHRQE